MTAAASEAPKQSPIAWYFALRAADAFAARHGRYPGCDAAPAAGDGAAEDSDMGQVDVAADAAEVATLQVQ
jgi:hypothetical protein